MLLLQTNIDFCQQSIKFIELSSTFFTLLLTHPALLLFGQRLLLLTDAIVIINLIQLYQFFNHKSMLRQSFTHKLSNPSVIPWSPRQVGEKDWVVRKGSSPLIVVLVCFADGIPHVEQCHQLNNEGRYPQHLLITSHLGFSSHVMDKPSCTDAFSPMWKLTDVSLFADVHWGSHSPTYRKCRVCDEL